MRLLVLNCETLEHWRIQLLVLPQDGLVSGWWGGSALASLLPQCSNRNDGGVFRQKVHDMKISCRELQANKSTPLFWTLCPLSQNPTVCTAAWTLTLDARRRKGERALGCSAVNCTVCTAQRQGRMRCDENSDQDGGSKSQEERGVKFNWEVSYTTLSGKISLAILCTHYHSLQPVPLHLLPLTTRWKQKNSRCMVRVQCSVLTDCCSEASLVLAPCGVTHSAPILCWLR